jgi:hypothetical protein
MQVSLMCSYLRDKKFENFKEVPDPYWSDDARGFNQVQSCPHFPGSLPLSITHSRVIVAFP